MSDHVEIKHNPENSDESIEIYFYPAFQGFRACGTKWTLGPAEEFIAESTHDTHFILTCRYCAAFDIVAKRLPEELAENIEYMLTEHFPDRCTCDPDDE